jgi:hypothetical protein
MYAGERWNTVNDAAWSATMGTNWIADAPVPMTATRFPRRSKS